jgi:hypothetical protein
MHVPLDQAPVRCSGANPYAWILQEFDRFRDDWSTSLVEIALRLGRACLMRSTISTQARILTWIFETPSPSSRAEIRPKYSYQEAQQI